MDEIPGFKKYGKREMEHASLIVGWSEEAANLSARVVDYLNDKLNTEEYGEIEPADFFPLGGVSIEDDIAQFPESKFYCSYKKNLVILKSNAPRAEWHKFLNLVLASAARYCRIKEIYTIGTMVAFKAHTSPRELFAVSNSPEMKTALSGYHLHLDMDYETPPGQRPTMSAFLLWVARNRGISAANLWVPVPFYLTGSKDVSACRKVVDFLDKKLSLGVDLKDLDDAEARQNEKLSEIRFSFPDVDILLKNLENGIPLSQDDSEKLAKDIEEYLRRID